MTIDLLDARQKLKRAGDHISELEKLIDADLASDFYKVIYQSHNRLLRLNSLHPPDKNINAIIGDVIGNLRSALGYAAVAIATPISGKSDGVYFPFADDVKGLKGQVGKTVFPQTIKDALIDQVQAYKGGAGEPLWAINKLRNIDKHRFLLVTVNTAGIRVSGIMNGHITMHDCFFGGTAGQDQNLIAGLSNWKFTKQPQLVFEVSIEEVGIVDDAPAVKFLQSLSRSVSGLLDSLEII